MAVPLMNTFGRMVWLLENSTETVHNGIAVGERAEIVSDGVQGERLKPGAPK